MSELYSRRLVAYLDILGFSQLIEKSAASPHSQKQIQVFLENYLQNNVLKLMNSIDSEHETCITLLSDSIIISMNPFSLDGEIPFCFELMTRCLIFQSLICINLGLFTRGALTIGEIYHNSNVVFGPALIEAYGLEKSAGFPRIILSDSFLQLYESVLRTESPKWNKPNHFPKKDFDGKYFLDFVELAAEFRNSPNVDQLGIIRKSIVSLCEEARNDRRLIEKAVWCIEYYNDFVNCHPDYNLKLLENITLTTPKKPFEASEGVLIT